MRLTAFKAKKVYGYLEFDFTFFRNVSFIVGVNGSGKTTVLRLIQALLTPSLRELIILPFAEVSIIYEEGDTTCKVYCTKSHDAVSIGTSHTRTELSFPTIDADELEYIIDRSDNNPDLFEEFQLKNVNHEVFQFISNINAPLFLGLDRTYKGYSDHSQYRYYIQSGTTALKTRQGLRGKRIVQGSLAAGLMESQALIQEAYRRLRRSEDKVSERLRESILISTFRYVEFDLPRDGQDPAPPDWGERSKMLQRKGELQAALRNIGLSGERVTKELDEFFTKLNTLFASMSGKGQARGFNIEWLINRSQIDRLSALIKIIDDNRLEVARIYAPINTFLETLKGFYGDTKKSIQVDTVGQLSIVREDNAIVPIEALSSGERQLLIIFAHLLFNEYGSRSNVFIIDEPELSLHLKWQENFVSKAIEVSPKTQLIMATHSPEIIAGFEKYSICL